MLEAGQKSAHVGILQVNVPEAPRFLSVLARDQDGKDGLISPLTEVSSLAFPDENILSLDVVYRARPYQQVQHILRMNTWCLIPL